MYKPNFCAECGARIEVKRWRVWTSRKFCAPCARRFQRPQIFLAIFACTTLYGLGLIIKGCSEVTGGPKRDGQYDDHEA